MRENISDLTLTGRLHANGTRCVLFNEDSLNGILIKCPGLGQTLIADIPGISVKSGSPMVDVRCEITGCVSARDFVPPFDFVFADITELIVYGEDGRAIPIDLNSLSQLSHREIEDCDYFIHLGRSNDAEALKERFIRARKAW